MSEELKNNTVCQDVDASRLSQNQYPAQIVEDLQGRSLGK